MRYNDSGHLALIVLNETQKPFLNLFTGGLGADAKVYTSYSLIVKL